MCWSHGNGHCDPFVATSGSPVVTGRRMLGEGFAQVACHRDHTGGWRFTPPFDVRRASHKWLLAFDGQSAPPMPVFPRISGISGQRLLGIAHILVHFPMSFTSSGRGDIKLPVAVTLAFLLNSHVGGQNCDSTKRNGNVAESPRVLVASSRDGDDRRYTFAQLVREKLQPLTAAPSRLAVDRVLFH